MLRVHSPGWWPKCGSLSGLGSLGALSGVSALKASLNAVERASGSPGLFSVGTEDNNLGGDAGWAVVRATINLLIRAVKVPGDVGSLAASLIGNLSSVAGDALSSATVVVQAGAKAAGSILGYLNGDLGYALWSADQISGKKYLAGFLADAASTITSLATAYLQVLKTGAASGPAPTSPTAPTTTSTTTGTGIKDRFPSLTVTAYALNTPQVVYNEDTTPIRPSLAKPALVIGGAAAIAAAIYLVR